MSNKILFTFPLKTRYARYEAAKYFGEVGRYPYNDSPYFRLASSKVGPILTASVVDSGGDNKPADGNIFIKDWSENEGVVDWMLSNNLIIGDVVREIPSGYVMIKEYQMGPILLQLLGEWDSGRGR